MCLYIPRVHREHEIVLLIVIIDQLQFEKVPFYFLKTIVFNALIPNILLSRLSDQQKFIFRI